MRKAFWAALALAIAIGALQAGEVNMSWLPSAGAEGYRVYLGAGQVLELPGTSTPVPIPDACEVSTLSVTAYSTAGESAPSVELMVTARPRLERPTVGPLTWLIPGDNFAPGLELWIFSASNPAVPLPVPHTIQDCQTITVQTLELPGSTDYFKLKACTNGGTVCSEYLLVPDVPTGLAVS